jgi:hypothetical protein
LKTLNRIALPIFSLWLLGWIIFSWPAIQDDALIHLRYADHLLHVHFITYDGVHPSYGTSSLLYVGLLAALRAFTTTALLSRAASTVVHILLYGAMVIVCVRASRVSTRVHLLALSTLLLLVVPSAVRWLDDGMETGIVVGLVLLLVAYTHRLSLQTRIERSQIAVTVFLGFILVILRIELGIATAFAVAVLCLTAAGSFDSGWFSRLVRALPTRSGFLVGAILAAISIRLVMHHLLPDTALAKAGAGEFLPTLRAAAKVIAGGLIFGAGALVLWLLSAFVVLRQESSRRLASLTANLLFPLVLLLSAVRGQAIQGVRYLIWTFFFSILWNLLELWHLDHERRPLADRGANQPQGLSLSPTGVVGGPALFVGFLILCLVAMPVDVHYMRRTLVTRARTMKLFMSEDLSPILSRRLGVAYDIGYIGYFTDSPICDLAGLVNGRAVAALNTDERTQRCANQHPDYLFTDTNQTLSVARYLDLSTWRLCGIYDFGNTADAIPHYLIVKPALAAATCKATGFPEAPASDAFTERNYR